MESLRHLEVFRAVARASSFTRAADELHMSQPVVSRTVRELERSLGVDLFTRTTRSVALTPEGAELFDIVTDLLDRFDTALERFTKYCHGEYGRIVVADAAVPRRRPAAVGARRLPRREPGDAGRDPRRDGGGGRAVRPVGKADITIAAPGPETAALAVQRLLRDRFVAVMAATHPLVKGGRSPGTPWPPSPSSP